MKFYMNLYYDAKDLIMKKIDIKNDIFNGFGKNNFENLYNRLYKIKDNNIANKVCKFISNASVEELKEYIRVDESSVRYDGEETNYCNRRTLAYLVDIEFDVEKLVNKLNDKEEDKEMEHPFERSEKEIER